MEKKKDFKQKELLIKFNTTNLAIEKFFEKFNEQFIRAADPRRLKSTTLAVARACVLLYGKQLSKKGQALVPSDELEEAIAYADDFETNSNRVAKIANCCSRTVRTHIKKLHEANFFSEKIPHGPRKNYGLRFNPTLLRVKQYEDVRALELEIDKILKSHNLKNEIPTIEHEDWQSLPPIDSPRNSNKNNNDVLTTLKGSSAMAEGLNQDTLSGDRGESTKSSDDIQANSMINYGSDGSPDTALNLETKAGPQKNEKDVDKSDSSVNKPSKEGKSEIKRTQKVEKLIDKLTLDFFLLAYKLIYTDKEFSKKEIDHYAVMLKPYFHYCTNEQQAQNAFDQFKKRLEMAANYYKNHPGFDKLPIHKYFNPKYKNGFTTTKAWYKKYIIDTVFKSRTQNVNKMVLSLKDNPTLTNFSECKTTVESWGNDYLTHKLLKSVTDLNFK
jgi:hypothetical protein